MRRRNRFRSSSIRSRPSRAMRRCGSRGALRCRRSSRSSSRLVRPDRPLLISGRAAIFLLVTMLLSAGVLTNLTFKSYWGRPRPVVVTQFGGDQEFVPWWDPRGACARNCSFFSGEGATAFWTYAPAALAPPAWRPLAYVGSDAVWRHHQRLADGVRRAFLHRRRHRRPRHVLRDLVCLRPDLPLGLDPADRRTGRCRADPAWRGPATGFAGASSAASHAPRGRS